MVALKYRDPTDGTYKLLPVGGPSSEEVWIGPTAPQGGQELWYDTSLTPPIMKALVGGSWQSIMQSAVKKTGDTMTGSLTLSTPGTGIVLNGTNSGLFWGTEDICLIQSGNALYLMNDAGTIFRNLSVATPTAVDHAVNKAYVDGTGTSGRRYVTTIGDGAALSYTVTHGIGSQNLHVTVRQTATPFERVDCVVRFPTVNTVTIITLTAPASGAYTVTVST